MFTRIQARNFRCLRYVDREVGRFQALVGPNASGKTTFLDVAGFLGDLIRNRGDVAETVLSRSKTFEQLTWMGRERAFQLAVEAEIPAGVAASLADDKREFTHVRYEVEVGFEETSNEIGINHENFWLVSPEPPAVVLQRELFPDPGTISPALVLQAGRNRRMALTKTPGGNANYYTEGKSGYRPSFKLGRDRSALAHTPADVESFPISSWFRDRLEQGVQALVLNSQLMRQPSPPGLGRRFQADGSNLPWVIADLRRSEERFRGWLSHVRTAFEDIRDIDTVERPEDRHRYLIVEYNNGVRVPSWLVSDGTLRLLVLTIPAYVDGLTGTYLIEEPENGVHPRAIETVVQSLRSVYEGQILLATHSPVALNMLSLDEILCFAKNDAGATDVIRGDQHPALRNWKKGEPDLGTLFASGVLS